MLLHHHHQLVFHDTFAVLLFASRDSCFPKACDAVLLFKVKRSNATHVASACTARLQHQQWVMSG